MKRAYRRPKTLMQRIVEKIIYRDGHWLWNGAKAWNKTARINVDGCALQTGRVMYVMCFGDIPPAKKVVSSCKIPNCIHPKHLCLVSAGEAQRIKGNMIKAGRPRHE